MPAQSSSGLALVACALSAVELRVKWADYDVESHTECPLETMVRRLSRRPEMTKPRGQGNALRDKNAKLHTQQAVVIIG